MDFIRRLIEQEVAAAVGMPVAMERFSVSPLSGSLEIVALSVGTLLTIKRLRAKISVAKALKQEFVLKSLTVESPLITIEGSLPRPPRKSGDGSVGAVAKKSGWSFEAEQALIVGGECVFRRNGYVFAGERLDGNFRQTAERQWEFTVASAACGRRDRGVELGPAQIWGTLAGGALDIHARVGSVIEAAGSTASVTTGPWACSIDATAAIELLVSLLPASVVLPIAGARGEATLSAAVTADRERGVTVDRFAVSTRDVRFDFPPAGELGKKG